MPSNKPDPDALARAETALKRADRSGTHTAYTFLALVAGGTYTSYGLERTLWVMAVIFGVLLVGAIGVFGDAKKAQVEALGRYEEKTDD